MKQDIPKHIPSFYEGTWTVERQIFPRFSAQYIPETNSLEDVVFFDDIAEEKKDSYLKKAKAYMKSYLLEQNRKREE